MNPVPTLTGQPLAKWAAPPKAPPAHLGTATGGGHLHQPPPQQQPGTAQHHQRQQLEVGRQAAEEAARLRAEREEELRAVEERAENKDK